MISLHRKKLRSRLNFFEKHPDIGVIYTDAIIIDSDGNVIKYYRCPDWNKKEWLFNHYIIMSSVLIRRKILNIAGTYYDETLKTCEDLDLLLRLSNITKFKRIPEFLTYYTIHDKNLSRVQVLMFDINRIRVFYKYKLLLPLLHSVFVFIRNQVISKLPIIGPAYEKISKKFKKHHFWE